MNTYRSAACSMTRRVAIVAVTTSAMLLAACVDSDPSAPLARTGSTIVAQNAIARGDVDGNVRIQQRFAISAEATGSLTPGTTVGIRATVVANAPSDAVITIAVPEVAAAEMSSWDQIRLPSDRIAPAAEIHRSMSSSEAVTVNATVTVAREGYYRVIVRAQIPDGDPKVDDNGRVLENIAVAEYWLLVTESGGALDQTFSRTRFPEGAAIVPGPFQGRLARTAHSGALRSASMDDPVTYQIKYYNSDFFNYPAIPYATVYYAVYDIYSGYTGTSSTGSDVNGIFYLGCPASGTYYQVSVYLESGRIKMSPASPAAEFSLWDTDCDGISGTVELTSSNADRSVVYANSDLAARNSQSFFGYSRSQIKVALIASGDNAYSPSGDSIRISSKWGTYGVFAQAHEYGHALHEKQLGAMDASSNDCPNSGAGHAYDREQTLKCGLAEGFASYHAVSVMGSAAAYYTATEADSVLDYGEDGAIVPHAVAAFLFDLTDSGIEAHDSIAYSGYYVATVLKTCQWKVGASPWVDADGIDHLVWCFENAVDASITSGTTYFGTRGTDPTNEQESASEPGGWSQAKIRTSWLHNLYGV